VASFKTYYGGGGRLLFSVFVFVRPSLRARPVNREARGLAGLGADGGGEEGGMRRRRRGTQMEDEGAGAAAAAAAAA